MENQTQGQYNSTESFANEMFPSGAPYTTVTMNKKEYEEYILWKKRTKGVTYI